MLKFKYILFISILPLLLNDAEAQQQPINAFYNTFKKEKEAFHLSLPGWLIRWVVGISGEKKEMNDMEKKVLKGIKKMKLLIVEDSKRDLQNSFKKLIHKLEMQEFEPLVSIREQNLAIILMSRDKKDKITNLFLFVNEEEELVMISLKTNIPTSIIKENQEEVARNLFYKYGS